MFFFLALVSTFAYSFQTTLLSHQVRQLSAFSVSFWRQISLIISCSPLLLGVDWTNLSKFSEYWPWFLVTAICGGSGLILSFRSVQYLPIAVSQAFRRASSVILTFFLGFLVFGEVPTSAEILLSSVIVIAAVALSLHKKDFAHLDNNARKGIVLALGANVFSTVWYLTIAMLAREFDPFFSGYIGEIVIAGFLLLLSFLPKSITKQNFPRKISPRNFGKIFLAAAPTCIGTGAFVLAMTMGKIGVISAIAASGIFVSLALAHFLYGEKLHLKQILWICVLVVAIVGLKLLGE